MDENGRTMFGIYIKSLREGAKLTQKEAASRAKLSAPYLAQLERGQRNPPSRAALTRLAETYSVTPQSLWDRAEYAEQAQATDYSPETVEWAFLSATSYPDFSHGHRARQGPLTLDQKVWFIQMWEKSTGNSVLPRSGGEADKESTSDTKADTEGEEN